MNAAGATLSSAFQRSDSMCVVHYACENLHHATDRPPAVSAIATYSLPDGIARNFSRTEAHGDPASTDAEIALLEQFFAFVQASQGTRFVHWNMSRAQYGFEALAGRYHHLTGNQVPAIVHQSARYDLDDIICGDFGEEYATHPKMRTLAQLNDIHPRYALTGAEEANAFDRGDFGAIDRSAAEKVEWIARLCRLYVAGELVTLNSAGRLQFADGVVDAVAVVRRIGERLLYVQRELRHRHGDRTAMTFDDEYDDQDLVRSLLRLFFDDVRPEEHVPEYAGASSRVDFLLPEFGIAVELKHCRAAHDAKKLGEELLIDAARYAAHPGVRHLVCVVIDHDGRLQNPRGLENDLAIASRQEGLAVSVAIIDR